MAGSADIAIYVINLDQATRRLARMSESLGRYGFCFTRIPAVDGRGLPPKTPTPLHRAAFERDTGRQALPGEIGCYMSHLKALTALRDGPHPFGVVLEDDVLLNDRFAPGIEALTRLDHWDVVKLVNHRSKMFKRAHGLGDGVEIGRCLHGPGGSAAAYMVRRTSAAALIQALTPMCGPYDVELEAGWRTRMAVYSTNVGLADLIKGAEPSQIGLRHDYRDARFSWRDRLGAFRYRNREILARAAYCAQLDDAHETLWLAGDDGFNGDLVVS